MHTRLINLRDRIQVSHRLNFKSKMLEERRKRIIEHLPPYDAGENGWQLQFSEEEIRKMLEAGDVLSISKLFRAPIGMVR